MPAHSAKDAIDAIAAVTDLDALDEYLADPRVTVKEAAEVRRDALKSTPVAEPEVEAAPEVPAEVEAAPAAPPEVVEKAPAAVEVVRSGAGYVQFQGRNLRLGYLDVYGASSTPTAAWLWEHHRDRVRPFEG